jgi:hypothetical protein
MYQKMTTKKNMPGEHVSLAERTSSCRSPQLSKAITRWLYNSRSAVS